MDRCTGRTDISDVLLKTALNTIQSINQSHRLYSSHASEMRSEKSPFCLTLAESGCRVALSWAENLQKNAKTFQLRHPLFQKQMGSCVAQW